MSMAVAGRYARALADVAGPKGDFRAVQRELDDFAAVYRENAELRAAFDTPAVTLDRKMRVLEAILARLGVSQMTSNFLHVLVAHFRVGMIEEILQAFARIVNDRLGVVEVQIHSASALSEEVRRGLRERFEQVTRKRVEMDYQLDEKLLGGIFAQVRSTVYDGSVRGHLDRIRERLMAG
jgi:F-type H+-transporting ATPase subunit delta